MAAQRESLRRRLLTLAAELLAVEGEPVAAIVVTVEAPDRSTAHTIRSCPGELGTRPPPGLTPIEQQVYSVLTLERRNAKAIAHLAKRSLSYVRAALRSLRDKGLVDYQAPLGWRRREGS